MEPIEKFDVYRKDCVSRDIMTLIGGKWIILILNQIIKGPTRYSALQRAVPGITQKILTISLRKLEQNGIVSRKIYPVIPPKVEYSLTELGNDLVGLLRPLINWSEEHAPEIIRARRSHADEQENTTT